MTASVTSAIRARQRSVEKALRDGTLSQETGQLLTASYAVLLKDQAEAPVLAFARADQVEAGAEDGIVWATVTTDEEDRDGDIVLPAGRHGENYAKNPIWLFGHGEWALPVGTSRGPGGQLLFQVGAHAIKQGCAFDRADPDADFLYGKVVRGIVSATSIAFVPIEAYRRTDIEKAQTHTDRQAGIPPGYLFKQWDHTETSWVCTPANAGAVRDALDREKSFLSPRIQKALHPYAAQAKGCWQGWCPLPNPMPDAPSPNPPSSTARKTLSPAAPGGVYGESAPLVHPEASQVSGARSLPATPARGATTTALAGAPVSKESAMCLPKGVSGSCGCSAGAAGKPCGCAKGASRTKNTQADMEPTTQVPGARTGQPVPAKAVSDAYERGRQAALDGKKDYQNPYRPVNSREYQEWLQGFRDAKEELQQGQKGAKQVQDSPILDARVQESLASVTNAGAVGRGLAETGGATGGYAVGQDETQAPGFVGCGGCAGTGNCADCDGRGQTRAGDCPACSGTGECAACGGAGNTPKSTKGSSPMHTTTKAQDEEKEDVTDQDSVLGSNPKQENKDSADEPFSPKPAARVAAQLYQHYKDAMDWLDRQLKEMDHPGMAEYMAGHKECLQKAMDHVAEGLTANYPDYDMDKVLKAITTSDDSGKLETGEANKVDAGQVPPAPEDKASVDEPYNPAPGAGSSKDGTGAVDTDTEEILERYRDPNTGKMATRRAGIVRRTADGQAYLVRDKALTDAGREQRAGGAGKPLTESGREQRTGGSGGTLSFAAGEQADQAANARHGEYIVGSGKVDWGKKTKSYHATITKAAGHLKGLTNAPDLPDYHKAGLLYHAEALGKVCQDIDASHKAATTTTEAAPAAKSVAGPSEKFLAEFADFKRRFRQLTGQGPGNRQ